MIKVFHKIPREFKPQIQRLIDIAFRSTDEDLDEEAEEFYTLERDRFAWVLYISDDRKVLGNITLYKRQVPYKDSQILLGGIGGVCTDPKYRRKGIASSMLPHAIKALNKESCDIAYLCTDINSPWKVKMYEGVGFQYMPYEYCFLGNSDKMITRNDGFLLPVKSPSILNSILQDRMPFYIGEGRW